MGSLFLLGDGPLIDGAVVIERGGHTFRIEAAVTRPVLKVSEHRTQSSLDGATTRVLFPYAETPAGAIRVIDESTMRADYPGAHAYVESIRDELTLRDHGKKVYEAWFAYGRRQGLATAGRGQLLTTIYAAAPRFLVDPAPGRRFVNGYAVVPRLAGAGAEWSTSTGLRALRNLLECDAMAVYVGLTSTPIEGGYRCYAGGYIANFGIPEVTTFEIAELAGLNRPGATAWYAARAGINATELATVLARVAATVGTRAA